MDQPPGACARRIPSYMPPHASGCNFARVRDARVISRFTSLTFRIRCARPARVAVASRRCRCRVRGGRGAADASSKCIRPCAVLHAVAERQLQSVVRVRNDSKSTSVSPPTRVSYAAQFQNTQISLTVPLSLSGPQDRSFTYTLSSYDAIHIHRHDLDTTRHAGPIYNTHITPPWRRSSAWPFCSWPTSSRQRPPPR